jgi:hypothetical protein
MLATRFPFFSPDRYPFFARIAEDKSAALLVFAPVALVAVADAVDSKRSASATTWASLALTLVAVAFGHGLVMLFVGIAMTFLLVSARAGGTANTRRASRALVLAATGRRTGRMAMLARDRSSTSTSPALRGAKTSRTRWCSAYGSSDPRSAAGGLIVEPSELRSGSAARWPAWLASPSRGLGGARWVRRFAAASIPSSQLRSCRSSRAFGKIVLPWMAYRIVADPLRQPVGDAARALPRNATDVGTRDHCTGLLAMTLAALRGNRASARPDRRLAAARSDTREVLAASQWPRRSACGSQPRWASPSDPLWPAVLVVAVADRGTFVFAGLHAAAENVYARRPRWSGLAPGSPRVRRAVRRAVERRIS